MSGARRSAIEGPRVEAKQQVALESEEKCRVKTGHQAYQVDESI